MSVIGTGTIISKDNLDKFLPSLAYVIEGREIRIGKNLFQFSNKKRVSKKDEGELIAIDLNKDADFPFVYYFDEKIKYYKFITVMDSLKYFDNSYKIDNLFFLNNECFVYDGHTETIMYEIIKNNPKNAIPIKDLGLTVRSTNCCLNSGIRTLQELINVSEEDLRKIRNVGPKSILEIKDKLNELNLSFKEE